MKLNQFKKNVAAGFPGDNNPGIVSKQSSRAGLDSRRKRTMPISEEIMDYYNRLLNEHNQSGAVHAVKEYRIL